MGVNVAPNLKPRTTRQPQDTIDGHTRLVTIDWRLSCASWVQTSQLSISRLNHPRLNSTTRVIEAVDE